MADDPTDDTEKTEEPTSKRLEDAHKKGDVVKSQEVNTWFGMVAATLMFMMFSGSSAGSLAESLRIFLASPHDIAVDGEHLRVVWEKIGWALMSALLLPFGILVIGALAGNLVQHRLVFSAEQMKPKLSKISPVAGLKRMFSVTSLVNFAKGIAKLAIVTLVLFLIVWPERGLLEPLLNADAWVLLPLLKSLAVKLLGGVVAVMTVVAGLDYLHQKHKWHEKQKMTMKELRDEHKQMEGDPTVKAKLRQVRIERGRKRMMTNVPRASVVITNPTHYAVALEYEAGMAAPVCLAKGIDSLALKIREVAKEHEIPIIENPLLARALYDTVEVDEEIDPEHYKAVAQVIGYVMRIRGRLGANSRH